MSGMKADGVLYLAAEFIDTFKEINKQVSKGAIEVAKNNQIQLSVDEKSLLTSIDKTLGGKKLSGFDLSGVITSRLKQFSELDPSDSFHRKNTLEDLNFDLDLISRVNLSAIKKNNLKDMSADDITSAIEEVRTSMFKDNSPFNDKTKSPAKLITEIFLKNASNIKADIRKQLLEEFGEDVSKYGVSEKEANERLSNIYDSLTKRAEKQFELEGRQNKVTLEDVATENDITKIQGFYTRLKSLGGTISGKSKILGDMLENMFDDEGNIYNVEEEASDTILELGNDLRAYTEREKNLYKRLTASNRDKINPKYKFEDIIVDDEDVSDLKENNISQNKQNQEKGKLLEQSKEVLQVETDTANVSKEQTQEIEKQNKLLQEKKQTEKSDSSLKKDTNQKKTAQQQKNNPESSQSKIESNKDSIKGMEDLFDLMQELGINTQEQTNKIKEEKEQTKQVVQEKKKAVKETKKEVQAQQQTTDELKKQKDLKESSTNIKKDDKTSELQTTKQIKEETQQIVEQQEQIAEAKDKTLEATQKNLKAEQQISTEVKEQGNTEEQKPKIMLVHKGKKLPSVQKHGKSQAEIDAQIKAEKEKKEKRTPIVKSDLEEKQKAEAAAAADSEKAKAEEIENLNYIANLNKKLGEAEAQQAEKEAQKIQLSSEQMQKLKQGIQEATESLKEYKEVDEQIIKAQSDKNAYIISPETQNEMLQGGVLSSSPDMAEYIRSAYRLYKKTGNKADEDVLKEALRQYMLPVGKKNDEYTYRDDKYLYSKNGKEIKGYTKDKTYTNYIKQAQDEEAAYEKAQRKLPTLLDQKKSGQQSFAEASANIQQLLQEAELDADKVNEILASINGNLTNEEAIWKVINSYIKEANTELKNQQNISESVDLPLSESPAPTVEKKKPTPSTPPVVPTTPSIVNTKEVEQSEVNTTKEANKEANGFKLVSGTAEEAAISKQKFVEANKEVKQSAEKSVESVDKEDKALKNITKSKPSVNNQSQTEEDAKIKLESKYARLTKQKDFIQDNDISQRFLTKYADIESTEDIQFYIETATKLGQVKNELKNYFDADNVLIDNNKLDDASSALSYYYELLENLRELKLKITGESSKENVLFESFTEQKAADLAVQQYKDNLEKSFQKIKGSKNYIQGNDISQEFLTKYSDIEATDKMQEYVKNSLLIAQTKNQLSEYFDKEGNFTKKTYDKNGDLSDEIKQAQELLDLYNRLIDTKEKLELEITSNSSQETIRSLSVKAEQELKANVEKDYKKLLQSKGYIQNNLEQKNFIDKYNSAISTDRTNQFNEALLKQTNIKNDLDKQFNESGTLIGDPDEVQKLLKEYNELSNLIQRLKLAIVADNSEETIALKISQDAQKAKTSLENLRQTVTNTFSKISGSKEFIQGNDINDNFLKKYEGVSNGKDEGYKATSNLREFKNLGDELANVKTKLKISFDEAGNLKSTADPLQVQELLNKYDELVQKIQKLKLLIESPNSQESFLLKEFEQASQAADELKNKVKNNLNKILSNKSFMSGKDADITPLDDYFKYSKNIPSENLDKARSITEEIVLLKERLAASEDKEGNIIGEPSQIADLTERYNSLTNTLKALIEQIKLPNSSETVALKLAKDAEKAKKQLDDLKKEINTTLGKSGLFEAQTQKTIDSYGAFYGNSEGKKGDLVKSNVGDENILPKNFIAQQKLVEELVEKLKEYKEAIKELQSLRTSDDATAEQLEETNNKVKDLKDNITTLSQTIKTSGIANASEEQISKLKNSFEIFLDKNPNVAEPIRKQIEKYINTLSSGASVSKSAYSSMTTDLNKFKAAQASGSTIWEQMVGKMREGIAFLATKFSFYQIFNQFRQGFEVIHQFDDALTEMMKVSDETRLSLERYQRTTFDVADSIGTNALQIQNSTADFMRLGESLDQAAESARTANVLMNVSEFQSIDEATKSLIAMGAAYDDLSKMQIVDKLNEVGLKIA